MGICLWRHYWLNIKSSQLWKGWSWPALGWVGTLQNAEDEEGWTKQIWRGITTRGCWSQVWSLTYFVRFFLLRGPIFLPSGRVPSHLRQVSDWPETLHDSSRKMGPSNNERNWDVSCHTWLGLGKKWRSATEAKRTARDMRKSIPKQLKKKNVFFTSTVVQYSDNLHK